MPRDAVSIILYNDKKVLLQLRTDDAPVYPSKWGFFGGGIDKGEDKLKAIKREAIEELGYNLKNPKLVYQGLNPREGMIYIYIEKYDSSQNLNLQEGKALKWFPIDELKNIEIVPYLHKILLEIKDFLFE